MPGKSFSLAAVPAEITRAIEVAAAVALTQIKNSKMFGVIQNGWRTDLSTMGTYGTDYRARAIVPYAALGANCVKDAIYPRAVVDADGRPFFTNSRYVIHFTEEQIPPVRAFWSLTMSNERHLFAANPLNRYAIGDCDNLVFHTDRSLDIHVRHASPGRDKE